MTFNNVKEKRIVATGRTKGKLVHRICTQKDCAGNLKEGLKSGRML